MQDGLTKSIQTGDSTVSSALQTQTAPDDPSPKNAADLTKDYKCSLGIKFPKTEVEKMLTLTNIESIVSRVTGSIIDLDFLRAKVMEEHAEEIMCMDFADLATMDLRTLPWSQIKFEALNLTMGSTILDCRITFN